MATTAVSQLVSRLQSIDPKIVARDVINRDRNFVAELNREQLLDGEKSDNSPMPPYNANSFRMKSGPVSPAGTFTLKETGQFHASITAEADLTGVTLKSNQESILVEILKQTGKDPRPALGLNVDGRAKLQAWLLPQMRTLIRQRL